MERRKAGSGLQFLPSLAHTPSDIDVDFHMLSTSLHNVCNFKDWRLKEDKHQTREFLKNYEYKLHMIYTVELHPPITPSLK